MEKSQLETYSGLFPSFLAFTILIVSVYDEVHEKLKIGVPHGSDAKFSTKMTVFDAVKNHEITLWYPLSIAKIVEPTGYLLWQGKIEEPQKSWKKGQNF